MMTVGAVALAATDTGAASVLLLTGGLTLVLVAWLGPRLELESFELLGAKIQVRQVVRRRLELAESQSTRRSEADRSDLREQAATVQQLNHLYGLYGHIRATQPASDRRTIMLDDVAQRMQSVAADSHFEAVEVATWFHEGTDELRVVALNVMLTRPECRDVLAVLEAIEHPRNLFEQYYGLRLALAMCPQLDTLERRLIAEAVLRAQRKRRFRRDRPLVLLADELGKRLGSDG